MPFSRGGGSGRRRRSSGLTMPACWSVTGGRRTATSPPRPSNLCGSFAAPRARVGARPSPRPVRRTRQDHLAAGARHPRPARRGRHLAAWRRCGPWPCGDSPVHGTGPRRLRPGHAAIRRPFEHRAAALFSFLFEPHHRRHQLARRACPASRRRQPQGSVAGIARPAAPTPNKCSRACCAPLSNASSTRPRCWSNSFARPSPPSPRPSLLPRSRHPGNQLPFHILRSC